MRITVIILALLLGGCSCFDGMFESEPVLIQPDEYKHIMVVRADEVGECEFLTVVYTNVGEGFESLGEYWQNAHLVDRLSGFAYTAVKGADTITPPEEHTDIFLTWKTNVYNCGREDVTNTPS